MTGTESAREGAREDAREDAREGATEDAREGATEGAREDAMEGATEGATEDMKVNASRGGIGNILRSAKEGAPSEPHSEEENQQSRIRSFPNGPWCKCLLCRFAINYSILAWPVAMLLRSGPLRNRSGRCVYLAFGRNGTTCAASLGFCSNWLHDLRMKRSEKNLEMLKADISKTVHYLYLFYRFEKDFL